MLGSSGYETAKSGRLHLWWADKKAGFEKRLAGDDFNSLCYGACRELWDGGKAQDDLRKATRDLLKGHIPTEGVTGVGPKTAWIDKDKPATEAAIDFIRQNEKDKQRNPFLLYLGFYLPHTPYISDKAHYEPYAKMPVDIESFDESLLPPFYVEMGKNKGFDSHFSPENVERTVRAYYGMVQTVDELLGQVISELENQGILDNTVVIYTSDHGDMLGRKGWWHKQCLFEGSIKVPLIMRYPERFSTGSCCKTPVSLIDLFPTITDLAEVEPYPEAEGISLISLLEGKEKAINEDKVIFAEYASFGLDQPTAMIRKGKFKLIYAYKYKPVLYNLEDDPHEINDLANAPDYSVVLKDMEKELFLRWNPKETRKKVKRNQLRTEIHARARRPEKGWI